jgi:hypothetical protein
VAQHTATEQRPLSNDFPNPTTDTGTPTTDTGTEAPPASIDPLVDATDPAKEVESSDTDPAQNVGTATIDALIDPPPPPPVDATNDNSDQNRDEEILEGATRTEKSNFF